MQKDIEYKLNREGLKLNEGLNIDMERFVEIVTESRVAKIRGDDMTEVFEIALNAVQPQNMVEAALLGYVIGHETGKAKAANENPLARLLAQMGS